MRTTFPFVLRLALALALALALVAAFVAPARAQYMPHTANWWAAAAADQADYEAMAAPSQAPWVPVGSLDYEYDVQGLEDTLGAGGAELGNYGNPSLGSANFGDAYGASADWSANLNLPVASGAFGSGGFGSGGFGSGGFGSGFGAGSSTKSAMPTFQAAMPTTTKAQRVYAPQVLQTLQEQLPETTASPKYLQPVIKTHVIDQPVIQPKIVRQPIIQQRIVEQPVLRTRIVNQPVIRRIVTQPVLRPRIIQQTQYQPQYIDQPVVQPRIIEQTIVREQLMEKQQQNQPIVSAPLTSSKKGGASYQQQF